MRQSTVSGAILLILMTGVSVEAQQQEVVRQAEPEAAATDAPGTSSSQTVKRLNGQTGIVTIVGANGVVVPSASRGKITLATNATSSNAPDTIVSRDASGSFFGFNLGLSGVLILNEKPFLHAFGTQNTFVGADAGNMTLTGTANSALGSEALRSDTDGGFNSAFGASALSSNTEGKQNSAFGAIALVSNTTGFDNSAFGAGALSRNVTGYLNSAFGSSALFFNEATQNSAFGAYALLLNKTGSFNSAFGDNALHSNTGGGNSAFGAEALYNNTTGTGNDAFGVNALLTSTTGNGNSAFGNGALVNLSEGDRNVAVGAVAGAALRRGSDNLYIGSPGGVEVESNTTRIGNLQTSAYVSGIFGQTASGGTPVFVTLDGRLGTMPSSLRYKEDVSNMGEQSDVLLRLRPVSFFYRSALEPARQRQYGLIAEEVAQVAPGLVTLDREGRPEAVQYQAIEAMLLNEVQKQSRLIERQGLLIERQAAELEELRALIGRLASRLPDSTETGMAVQASR